MCAKGVLGELEKSQKIPQQRQAAWYVQKPEKRAVNLT
jgi:hypothetical protein